MGRIIKVKCNGPKKHVNDVDIDKAQKVVVVAKIIDITSQSSPPERIVLPCRECTIGKVILTRKMLEEIKSQHG